MTAFPFIYYNSIMTENGVGATIDDQTGDVVLPRNITATGTATFDEMNVSGNVTFSGAVALGSPATVNGINSQSLELVDTVGGGSSIRGRVVQDSTNSGYIRVESYDSDQNLQGYVEVSGDGNVDAMDASGNGVRFDTTNGSISVQGAPNELLVENPLMLRQGLKYEQGGVELYANEHLNISFNGNKLFTFRSDDIATSSDQALNVRLADRRYTQTSTTVQAFEELRNSSNGDKVDAAISVLENGS